MVTYTCKLRFHPEMKIRKQYNLNSVIRTYVYYAILANERKLTIVIIFIFMAREGMH